MRIENFLRESARRSPGKTALIAGGRRMTYAELDDLSDRLSTALHLEGIGRGDRVIVLMDNVWEAAVAIFAVLKAGAIFSPLNPTTKADKIGYVLRHCRAAGVIAQARFVPELIDGIGTGPRPLIVVAEDGTSNFPETLTFAACLRSKATAVRHGGIDVDLAMLVYTSGSTGHPKGVMMTHRNVDAAATSITTYLESSPDDIVINVLPLSFDYGLYQLLMSVKVGATLVLERSFAYPQAVFSTMRRERVTGLPLVPTMAAMILQMRDLKPGFLPDLRYVTNTAAALPPAHIARLRKLLPGVRIYSMYGQTECKRCTWLPPEQLDTRPDSVGLAIPNTEAYVADENGRRVPAGEVGELVIRGPHVMQGYWEDPEATARALRPGEHPWERVLHTGDLFRTDPEGFLYFVSRKDDIIKTRGEKVAPKEVETAIHACPGVAEVVVLGVPDPILGQAVKAIVVPAGPGLSEADVIRHCRAHLEDFMVPKLVEFRETLPRTETGKVSRRLAAAPLEPAG